MTVPGDDSPAGIREVHALVEATNAKIDTLTTAVNEMKVDTLVRLKAVEIVADDQGKVLEVHGDKIDRLDGRVTVIEKDRARSDGHIAVWRAIAGVATTFIVGLCVALIAGLIHIH